MKSANIISFLKGRSNIVFIAGFLLISLACFLMRETVSYESVATRGNSLIELPLNGDSRLSQSWQADKKKLVGIAVPTQNGAQLTGSVTLYLAQDGTVLAGPVELSLYDNGSDVLYFEFARSVPLNLGERYEIILTGDAPEAPLLLIKADSDHYGGFIDEQDLYQAAGIEIQYVKTSRLFWVYLILTVILAVSLSFMLIFQKSFADIIGMSIIAIVFLLYLFGILGQLETGIRVLAAVSFLLLAGDFTYIIKKNIRLADLASPAVLIWLALFVVIAVRNQGFFRAEWDEFSHWGLAAKDMFYSDSLANYVGTNVLMPSYPPFLAVFQYLMMYANMVFSDSFLYVAYQLLIVSLLCTLLKNTTFRNLYSVVAGSLFVLMMPLVFFESTYHTIYADSMLGILMAYLLICYFTEEMHIFNIIRISLAGFALILTKDAGVVLAGVSLLIILGDFILQERKNILGGLGKMLLLSLAFILTFASWRLYLRTTDNTGSDLVETGLGYPIAGVFMGQGTDHQYMIMKNYLAEVFSVSTYQVGPLLFSTGEFLLTLLLLAFIIKNKGWAGRRSGRLYRVILGMTVGSIVYFIFIMLTYVFIFQRADYFTSFIRYHGTYLQAALIVFLSLLFIYLTETAAANSRNKIGIALIALLIMTPLSGFYNRPSDRLDNLDALYGYDEIAETFRGFADSSERVYYICNGSNGYSSLVFLNTVLPLHSDYLSTDIHSAEAGARFVSATELKNRLSQDYQYVYIQHADDAFKQHYQDLFADVGQVADGTVFKVIKEQDDGITLKYIAKIGVKDYI